MAHTDPNTGVTRDKYGNEVTRDATGTDPHSHTSYWGWAIGAAIAFALVLAFVNMGPSNERPTADNRPITDPVTPKAPPPPAPAP